VRCAALDLPVLAEACDLLGFARGHWPLGARTHRGAAERTLAVAGALGCVVAARRSDNFREAAAWALSALAQTLAEIGAQRQASAETAAAVGDHSLHRSAGRMRTGTGGFDRAGSAGRRGGAGGSRGSGSRSPASRARLRRAASNPALQAGALRLPRVGDEVLAHWPLPDGSKSRGVEDALVLGADPGKALIALRFIDGMELEVPPDWVATRPDGKPIRRNSQDTPSEENEEEEEDVVTPRWPPPAAPSAAALNSADYPLLRLLQVAAPAAEICGRMRDLFDRPRGLGLDGISAALRVALAAAPVAGQRACMEALCTFCNGGAEDAMVARHIANSILLSGCARLSCTSRQLEILRHARPLSEVQRAKLVALCQPAKAWQQGW